MKKYTIIPGEWTSSVNLEGKGLREGWANGGTIPTIKTWWASGGFDDGPEPCLFLFKTARKLADYIHDLVKKEETNV